MSKHRRPAYDYYELFVIADVQRIGFVYGE